MVSLKVLTAILVFYISITEESLSIKMVVFNAHPGRRAMLLLRAMELTIVFEKHSCFTMMICLATLNASIGMFGCDDPP